ncbi:hypothetical protein BTJ39_12500 [Izhakiella australiensis]|uniref:Uncharacterized protein n=1 Tax=Izhakiella australiensis TaxID=1926881 RepID=A0A1S8YK99_9GAMM|nr:hypothetical protein BTJ39_12500 [Izhakiella australiensis]
MRGNLKWELYEETLPPEAAPDAIRVDTHGCFFGQAVLSLFSSSPGPLVFSLTIDNALTDLFL